MASRLTMTAALAAVLAVGFVGCQASAEERAIAEIQKLGGTVKQDANRPGRPVILVNLNHTEVTNAALKCLEGLTQLQELDLRGPMITDVGLEHLKGLRQLHDLDVWGTGVTDAGAKGLKNALPNIEIHPWWRSPASIRDPNDDNCTKELLPCDCRSACRSSSA